MASRTPAQRTSVSTAPLASAGPAQARPGTQSIARVSMIAAARPEPLVLLPAASPNLAPASLSGTPRPAYEVAKRAFDIAVASLLLVTLSPLLLITFVVVKVTSPGPAIFRQMRCGRDGAPFVCFKFRTMVSEAEEMRATLLASNEHSGPVFKMRRDPRVTRVGRLLRKSSVDELPQLWNVVRGDMSLVGPRPPLPDEVSAYTPREFLRLAVRPGMTGLWQVSGRSTLTFERWMELDLEYVQTRSFVLDLRVILLTVPAVISGRGAW